MAYKDSGNFRLDVIPPRSNNNTYPGEKTVKVVYAVTIIYVRPISSIAKYENGVAGIVAGLVVKRSRTPGRA